MNRLSGILLIILGFALLGADCNEEPFALRNSCMQNPDQDGDGFNDVRCRLFDINGDDCDDSDINRYPGNEEVCDAEGHDEDCSPSTVGNKDDDGDGFVDIICSNTSDDGIVVTGDDCDDTRAEVNIQQVEVCNGIDDDCDGDTDENLRVVQYPDADSDGFGEQGAVSSTECPGAPGFAPNSSDCDDTNAQIFPGSIECVNPNTGFDYQLCQDDGTWALDNCEINHICVIQPGLHGICIPV